MIPKAHLTLHSSMSGCRWVISPSWLSGLWRYFLYSSSLVLLEEGVCYDQCILLAIPLAFALLHFVLQDQIWLLLQVSLDFLLLHSSSLWWKGHVFWVLLLEVLVGLHRTIQLQLLWQPLRLKKLSHPTSWFSDTCITLLLQVWVELGTHFWWTECSKVDRLHFWCLIPKSLWFP